MGSFLVKKIFADGYERIAHIQNIETQMNFLVHFIEFDEYVEGNSVSNKRRQGDVLIGDLAITLVDGFADADDALYLRQKIYNSPQVEAVIEVKKQIDEYTLLAHIYGYNEPVKVEFESIVPEIMSRTIKVSGILELEIIEDNSR